MMRREALLGVNEYNETLRHASDYDLWSRLVTRGYQIANLNETLMQLRIHQQSDGMRARGRPELLEEMVAVSQATIRELLGLDVPQEQFLALTMLLRRVEPSGEASEPIKLLRMIARAFGPRGRPFYGMAILGIALAAPLRPGVRARLAAHGVAALMSFKHGLWGYAFIWREWVTSGRLLDRMRFEIRRLG
jgi:hypothetical protein